MPEQCDQVVLEYLSRVADAAHGRLRSDHRLDFMARLRTRIDEMRADAGAQRVAEVERIIARFGDPVALVERERRRLAEPTRVPAGEATGGQPPDATQRTAEVPVQRADPAAGPVARWQDSDRRTLKEVAAAHRLEATAIVLVGFGALVLPIPLWLLGVVLTMASSSWTASDKVVGIVTPLVADLAVAVALGQDQLSGALDPAGYFATVTGSGPLAFRIAALVGAAFLGWRLAAETA